MLIKIGQDHLFNTTNIIRVQKAVGIKKLFITTIEKDYDKDGRNTMTTISYDKKFNVIHDPDNLKVPIFLWLSNVEQGALDQMKNIASLPFAYHHVAGMPDMHQGYGMPIGGVLATKDNIIPNAVGKDIGCGMIALRTNLFVGGLPKNILKKIMGDIRKMIPIGVGGKHKKSQSNMPPLEVSSSSIDMLVVEKEYTKASKQLGTLGSGNHFIEIQHGSDGYIWIMIHSGSRNIGSTVCDHYDKLARVLNEKWYSKVSSKWGLSFLPFFDEIGQDYFSEMNFCCDYALANRQQMMEKVMEAFTNHVFVTFETAFKNTNINIHHNYAALENHYGENVLVHRKGATRAYKDEYGIIPGSQGSKSYIVVGKGNEKSFKSSSHGAGRVMGRNDAKRKLDLEYEKKILDEKGIIHGIRTKKDLEEATSAYKDIDTVMLHQRDLVDVSVILKPIAVIKG